MIRASGRRSGLFFGRSGLFFGRSGLFLGAQGCSQVLLQAFLAALICLRSQSLEELSPTHHFFRLSQAVSGLVLPLEHFTW